MSLQRQAQAGPLVSALEALTPRLPWPGPQPRSQLSLTHAAWPPPLGHSHKAAVGLLLILLVPHIIHIHRERTHSVGMYYVTKVVDVGGRAYTGQ